MIIKKFIKSEKSTLALGASLAKVCQPGDIIYLQGELGAGKTTLTRGFLRALGHAGVVKSPTYTLVETYHFNNLLVHHFDLYRLHDPHELHNIGLDDYITEDAIVLIEWPEKALELLPKPTITCQLTIPDDGEGREINIDAPENLIKALG